MLCPRCALDLLTPCVCVCVCVMRIHTQPLLLCCVSQLCVCVCVYCLRDVAAGRQRRCARCWAGGRRGGPGGQIAGVRGRADGRGPEAAAGAPPGGAPCVCCVCRVCSVSDRPAACTYWPNFASQQPIAISRPQTPLSMIRHLPFATADWLLVDGPRQWTTAVVMYGHANDTTPSLTALEMPWRMPPMTTRWIVEGTHQQPGPAACSTRLQLHETPQQSCAPGPKTGYD